ncbi:DUF2971 domain-containing protein [Aeromonas veronii]|uniref:DUF2971 domain-containing protein n=1 Tax=Aeromonas veronii TaxID=654 RepID=UPI001F1D9D99|nr:DUF2971 domain-containing protein [Aeromonas veronii]MCF5759181.1 DUF2971 domain-containing protein [Aeromonas veronii]
MNVFYKYYSSKLNILEYLDNPNIKLSTAKSFNDPFEESLPNKIIKDLVKSVSNANYLKDSSQYTTKRLRELYKNVTTEHGIVSLTENHRNLLMWAHYADSHKGFCIGYKKDFLLNVIPYEDASPKKVTYDKKRLDPLKFDKDDIPFDIIMKTLTTKSDEWIYEKEHRCIVSISAADSFEFYGDESSPIYKTIKRLLKQGMITRVDNNKYDLKVIDRGDFFFEAINYSNDKISSSELVSMYKKIKAEDIDSIFLGCRVSVKTIEEVKNKIASNPDRLGHIKVYRYETNKDNFELNLKSVINGRLDFDHEALTRRLDMEHR